MKLPKVDNWARQSTSQLTACVHNEVEERTHSEMARDILSFLYLRVRFVVFCIMLLTVRWLFMSIDINYHRKGFDFLLCCSDMRRFTLFGFSICWFDWRTWLLSSCTVCIPCPSGESFSGGFSPYMAYDWRRRLVAIFRALYSRIMKRKEAGITKTLT